MTSAKQRCQAISISGVIVMPKNSINASVPPGGEADSRGTCDVGSFAVAIFDVRFLRGRKSNFIKLRSLRTF